MARLTGRWQQGFTLIEIVLAILILGILGVVALPKFFDLGTQSRVATINATSGAVGSAVSMAATRCAAVAGCNVPNWSVLVSGPDGQQGTMFNGYPTGRSRLPSYFGIKDWVTVQGLNIYEIGTAVTEFRIDTAPDPQNCLVRYREVDTFGLMPTITKVTSGC